MKRKNKMKEEFLALRIDKNIKEKLDKIAKEERRTLSQLISIILEDWIKDRESSTK